MSQGRTWLRLRRVTGVLAIVGLLACPAVLVAQDEAPPMVEPNTGAISLDLGVDWVSQYIFRGIQQQNSGLILQPDMRVTAALYDGEDLLSSLDVYTGIWASVHSDSLPATNANKPWYEVDYSLGAVAGLGEDFVLDTAFVAKTFPSSGAAVTEVDIALAYDDAQLMADRDLPALNPYVLVALEMSNTISGTQAGYWEVGIAPSTLLMESEDYPVTLSIPVTLGLNLYEYYDENLFGYLDVGAVLSMPVTCIPVEYGTWTAKAGINLIYTDEAAQNQTPIEGDQDDLEVVASVGLSMSY